MLIIYVVFKKMYKSVDLGPQCSASVVNWAAIGRELFSPKNYIVGWYNRSFTFHFGKI
jgi:hypothetical protein